MKNNLFKILIFSLTIAFMVSCEESGQNVYTGDSYISFGSETSTSTLESSTDIVEITAYASIPNLSETITVDFNVLLDNATASNYEIVDGKSSFTFGPGKYTDSVKIMAIDNYDEDGDKMITLELSGSGAYILGFPGPDALGKTFELTLQDDDCAFTTQELGNASWSGVDNVPSSQAGPNESQIVTSFDGTNLLLEGIGYAWLTDTAYWEEVIVDSYQVIAEVDPITGVVTIALQDLCTTTWLGDPQAPYSVQGSGQYLACSETLVIDYDLIQNGGVLRSFSETLTKN
ncbi:hypothetical protein SAMN05444411_103116 [Lutibacter oricola]|uniref:Calx-beta domain-containing protein n=1 Tax=Lutibacter oricola TaxID=762486 RepID=A0A1H2Z102_9FLAO|nr:hypothetical protein [Lutibacter oricola]SDX11015.1 hypothetical protein SAMN05444411_103116 [Lutibacter oricola]